MFFRFLIFIFLTSAANADILTAMQSVCLIKDHGTGFVYLEDKENFYIMTAGHVADRVKDQNQECIVFFFAGGKLSREISAKIIAKDYNNPKIEKLAFVRDLAKIKVEKKHLAFSEYPKVVKIADPSIKPKIGDQILSIGCPSLNHPSMFHGIIIDNELEEAFYVMPDVIGGRSGSPVFDVNGEFVIGVVIWRTGHETGARVISPKGISNHFQVK